MTENKKKVVYIELADIQLHTIKPRNPKPGLAHVLKAIKTGKPTRAYSSNIQMVNNKMQFTLDLTKNNPELIKRIQKLQAEGKEVKLVLPEGGIPIYLGDDLVERIESEIKK